MVNDDLRQFLPEKKVAAQPKPLNLNRMREREREQAAALPELLKKDREIRKAAYQRDVENNWWRKIPRRWKKAKLLDFEQHIHNFGKKIVTKICNDNPLASCLIWSPTTGNGKTFLVYAILNELMLAGHANIRNTGFYTERDVAAIAMAGFDRDDKLHNMIVGKKYVFIDDFSNRSQYGWKNSNTENRVGIWFDIINYAYNNGVNLFITSNSNPEAIRDFVGAETFDRLWHLTGNGENIIELNRGSVRADVAKRVNEYYDGRKA